MARLPSRRLQEPQVLIQSPRRMGDPSILTTTEPASPWPQTLTWVCLGYSILVMKSEAVLRAAFRSSMLACLPARSQRNDVRSAAVVV